ncbi:protein FAM234A-like [Haliotis rubra]|uniref:protein FAM234A-like n=1 Tax=Haliotis rubra TaxID=36100 RepID=UPI001EE5A09E|nr:protein FAM234A-like [Haliotis rubra]
MADHYRKLLDRSDDELELDTADRTLDPPYHPPAVEMHDLKNKNRRARLHLDIDPRYRSRQCCSPAICAVAVASLLLGVGGGYLAGIFTRVSLQAVMKPRIEALGTWRTKFTDYGTESCIRLADADGDGYDDVIIGLAFGKDVSFMLTEDTMDQFCKDQGMETPCAGAVVALRGYDGKLLWQAKTYAEIFELNCHSIDVNRDGVNDCIATGRLGDIRAINIRNGEIMWASDGNNFNRGWNIYHSVALPDFDFDGVPEIAIAHGGDPTVAAEVHTRHAGWLMMLSGATGQPIGRPLEMPENKETYCAPVLHTLRDGSQYILYGSGGETVGGLFLAISVPDFYRYVQKYPREQLVPNVIGEYSQWGARNAGDDGVIEIFRSPDKGVMVPPVLIDMTGDGVKDILMSAFDGTVILFDGETLENLWKIKFNGRESYSTPAPGHFNDDDVMDFMVHWSKGAWPYYNTTDIVVLDGRDGSVLWNMTTNKYDVSSDLVARTSTRNRDVFLFRTQGRRGVDPRGTGAIHGATGIQRVINRRSLNGDSELYEQEVRSDSTLDGALLPEHHFRDMRSVDEDYIECESDQTVYIAESFAMDRTTMKRPLKLWEFSSQRYYYKLTDLDKQLVDEVIKKYGENFTATENEVPWSRGKREANDTSNTPHCILIQPDERTTGAVGDVDGDGKLDLIINVVSVGVLRDDYARFVKMKFNVDIFKVTLNDLIDQELYTPINATMHDKMKMLNNENSITSLTFLQKERQTWGGYLGTLGDSIFRDGD